MKVSTWLYETDVLQVGESTRPDAAEIPDALMDEYFSCKKRIEELESQISAMTDKASFDYMEAESKKPQKQKRQEAFQRALKEAGLHG